MQYLLVVLTLGQMHSGQHKRALRALQSWNRVAKAKVGKDIFAAVFHEADELKSAFGIAESVRGKRLRVDARFIAHSDLFADKLDFCICHLDDMAMVTESVEQLGRSARRLRRGATRRAAAADCRRHAALQLDDFRPEYWSIFSEWVELERLRA